MKRTKGRIMNFLRYLPLLKELVIRDIKVRYRHSVLGMLWTVLNPLLMMALHILCASLTLQRTWCGMSIVIW